ncbi:MAG: nucleotide exchange factor GrpE [Spirochaetaceae bacterium]|nr:nucleotide exchange factor GrpE [Spirochaetaceae bacterium]
MSSEENGEDLKSDAPEEPIAEIPVESVEEPDAVPGHNGPPQPELESPGESSFEVCGRMMNEISRQILMITENQDRSGEELKNLYNSYTSILRLHDKAAEELEQHRKGIYRQLLDPMLIALARIYIDYLGNMERLNEEQLEDTRLKKNFSNMFDDILQILAENDVETYVTKAGDKWSPKFCKIGKKTDTSEEYQHGAVIQSISPGFHIGNRVLIPENVEVFIFNNN